MNESSQIEWRHFDSSNHSQLQSQLEHLNVSEHVKNLLRNEDNTPQMDAFNNRVYVSVIHINKTYEQVKFHIIATEKMIVSYTKKEADIVEKMTVDFKRHPGHLQQTGYALYHIVDNIVMSHLTLIDKLADTIQAIEKRVFKTPFENKIGHDIYVLKGKLSSLRRTVEAHENVIKTIGRSKLSFINENAGFHAEDLLSHYARVTQALDAFSENVNGIFDLQMSLKSDHMNVIMKTLTMVSVIFLPMTFLAGLYGMNFERMPELTWAYGYAYALVLMITTGLLIAFYFKKKGWW